MDRHEFACPRRDGPFGDLDLASLDPADQDERLLLILSEHPELARAINKHRDEVIDRGQRINPRLHIAVHEIVANQLWNDDPPEVWQTAQRLRAAGYARHEILHMIGSALSSEMWNVLQEGEPADTARYVRALENLPGSWEAMRG